MSLISVVIPVFNRSHLLARTLDSVFRQTYPTTEIVLVDDHSSEDIERAIKKYPVRAFKSQGKGVSAARNTGIREAYGDWIAFLDSDDEWAPEKLQKQWEHLQQNPECRFVHTNETWIRQQKIVPQPAKYQKSGGSIFAKCTDACLIAASSVVARKDLFFEVGLFDETFIVCEDFDLWLRIAAQEEIGFLSEALTIKHGGHPDQLSLQHHSMDLWRVRALAKHLHSSALTEEQSAALHASLQTKSDILLKGFKKYPNSELQNEIHSYLQQIKNM
jgi:glycosyltransferase involved in cell wall biosynthesis